MLSKEDFEKLVNNITDKLDETTTALISEEILATLSAYNSIYDEYDKQTIDINNLKNEKDELLKVNGKLFQKIGFDKEENVKEIENKKDEEKEETKIEDVINEKGEII